MIKVKLFSFLASLIFIPVFMLGQLFGGFVGMFLAWFNSFFTGFNMPQLFSYITVGFVSGAFGGWIAAKAVMKMNKSFDMVNVCAIPVIIMVYSIIMDITDYANDLSTFYQFVQNIVRDGLTLALYITTLKDEAKIVS